MGLDQVIFDTLSSPDRSSLEALYNRCFPVPAGDSFLTDFPVWDPGLSILDRIQIGVRDGENLIATASARIVSLKPGSEKIAIIGGVATHPEHQGKKLAQRSIEEVMKRARAMNPVAYVLWGSEKTLYERFGFEFGGRQCRAKLADLEFRSSASGSKLELLDGWSDEIFMLMKNRPSGVSHRDADLSWISKQKSVLFFRLMRDGKCTAFVGIGRGIDLTNMIHEWAGEERELALILSVLKKENPDLEILFHPDQMRDYYFFGAAESRIDENLCMAKVESEKFDLSSVWFYGLDSC